jgi:NADH:ubiquinone oxidoreductase subunit 6 (subunit J)
VRGVVLTIALAFIAALGVLTGLEIAKYGVTVLSVLAILVLLLFVIGIVGALREPPRE